LLRAFWSGGRTLRRRFREETVTDLMMGSLIPAGGGRVIVEFPDEPRPVRTWSGTSSIPAGGGFDKIVLKVTA